VETAASAPGESEAPPESTTCRLETGAFARPGLSEARPESATAADERRIHHAGPMTVPNPTPDREDSKRQKSGREENVWVQVGRYSQLALVLPSATIVGWLLGTTLDHWLHASWISIVGLLLGSAAGLIEVIRTVQRDTK
jgi:hypothetical protein